MEVPSTEAGVVKEIRVKIGDKVSEGSPIVVIETAAAAADGKAAPSRRLRPPLLRKARSRRQPAKTPPPRPMNRPSRQSPGGRAPARTSRSAPACARQTRRSPRRLSRNRSAQPSAASEHKPHASPAVRKFARELGVDLHAVKGTGLNGRIFRSDVQSVRESDDRGSRRARHGAGAALDLRAVAENRLRQIRRDRDPPALAHPPHLEGQPRAQLGDDPARHPVRRGRRDRPRGLAPRTRRGARQGRRARHDARLRAQGAGPRADRISRIQLVARRRQPHPEKVFPLRLCRRHARRTGGAGDSRRR